MGVSRKKAWIVIYSSRFSNIGGAPDVGVAKSRVKLGVTPTKPNVDKFCTCCCSNKAIIPVIYLK
jgi:hypothetical protein